MNEKDNVPYKVFKKPLVAAIGNPLFDIVIPIPSMEVLHKCKISGKKIIGEDEFRVLYEQVQKRKDLDSWPGGSAQVTAQCFQWIVGEPGYIVMLGNVGSDAVAKEMESKMNMTGVQTRYNVMSGHKTGVCLNFTCGKERATVAYLGAASEVSTADNLLRVDRQTALKNLQIMYVEGFFLVHSYLVAKELLSICKASGIFLALNLSSVGLVNDYGKQMLEMISNSDIVFGNLYEFQALASHAKWHTTDAKGIIQDILKVWHSQPDKFKRHSLPPTFQHMPIIVVTNGSHPVTLSQGKKPAEEFKVQVLPPEQVIDDTGGGDAFVGGFLAAAVLGLSMQECVDWGSLTANEVLMKPGVHLPKERPVFVKEVAKRIKPKKVSLSAKSH